jgi:hypothetical protein
MSGWVSWLISLWATARRPTVAFLKNAAYLFDLALPACDPGLRLRADDCRACCRRRTNADASGMCPKISLRLTRHKLRL